MRMNTPAFTSGGRRRTPQPRGPGDDSSRFPSRHLRLPRWVGARPRACEGGGQTSEFEGSLHLFFLEVEIRLDRIVVVQPGQERGTERVAGPDRVDDHNFHRVNGYVEATVGGERSLRPERHHDQARSLAEDSVSRILVAHPRIEPGQVGIAGLDDGALGDRLMQTVAVLAFGGEPESDVGVDHHNAPVVLATDQLDQSGGHRLEHEPQRPQMNSFDLGAQPFGNHVPGEVGCRRALDEKLIFGQSGAIDLGNRNGRRFRAHARQFEAGPVGDQQVSQLAAEYVVRKAAEKGGRHAEPGERPGGVEGPSTGHAALRAVSVVDHVDQGLATDDDQGRISPEPRVIIRVRTTWCSDGDRSPSRRRKSTSAAVRPMAAGSWAMTVIPGSRRSASKMSSKPISATRWWSPSRRRARNAPIVIRFWPVKSAVGGWALLSNSVAAASAFSIPRKSSCTERSSSSIFCSASSSA